jgi:hypothetical protein
MRPLARSISGGDEVLEISLALPASRDSLAVRIFGGRTGPKQACIGHTG